MSREQSYILWIGLGLLLVYFFSDINIRDMLFGRKNYKPATTNAFLDSLVTQIGSSGIPVTGNGHTNGGKKTVLA